jgi:hypothetical protein
MHGKGVTGIFQQHAEAFPHVKNFHRLFTLGRKTTSILHQFALPY